MRIRTENRFRVFPEEVGMVHVAPLKQSEARLTERLDYLIERAPIYQHFLKRVKGIGPRIASTIIAQTMIIFRELSPAAYKEASKLFEENASLEKAFLKEGDREVQLTREQWRLTMKAGTKERKFYRYPCIRGIGAFATVSKYWKWWGVGMDKIDGRLYVQKRWSEKAFRKEFGREPTKEEQTITYNPKMKVLAYKIGEQFILIHGGYRDVYDKFLDKRRAKALPLGKCVDYEKCLKKLVNRETPSCEGHCVMRAKRDTVKRFISQLWEAWRRLEGLPVRPPYAMEYLGHSTYMEAPLEEEKVKKPRGRRKKKEAAEAPKAGDRQEGDSGEH